MTTSFVSENVGPKLVSVCKLQVNLPDFQCGHAGAVVERYRAAEALPKANFGVLPSHETRILRDQLLSRLNERRQVAAIRETDQEYFARRAAEEKAAAVRADSLKARRAHEELAQRYAEAAEAVR